MLRHRRKILYALALIVFGSACMSNDAPVAGPDTEVALVDGPSLGGRSLMDDELRAEKERIKQLREQNKARRDSLRVIFKRFKRDHKGMKKNQSPFPICDPQDYDGDVRIIGPEGGSLSAGGHKLTIPAGALNRPRIITMEVPVDTLVSVRLSPHGTRFEVEAILELSYKDCFLPSDYTYRMAYINENEKILELPLSEDIKHEGEVRGYLQHFSRYAVAY